MPWALWQDRWIKKSQRPLREWAVANIPKMASPLPHLLSTPASILRKLPGLEGYVGMDGVTRVKPHYPI